MEKAPGADEEEKKMSELSLREMEMVNGGTVVAGNDSRFYAVDERGCVIVSGNNKEAVTFGAKMNGLTQELISEADYEKKFGRKLDESWNPYC